MKLTEINSILVDRIYLLTGKKINPIHVESNHDAKRMICDITLAKTLLGYDPKVEINNGLMDEIKFFSENPRLWREK